MPKPSSLPINTKDQGIEPQQDEMLSYIYIYKLLVNATVRLTNPWSGGDQGQETFLSLFTNNTTRNYDAECSNHHPYLSGLRSKWPGRNKMKKWAMYAHTNLPVNAVFRL